MAVLSLTLGRARDGEAAAWRLASVSAQDEGRAAPVAPLLEATVRATPAEAPVVFFLHGYRYDPNGAAGHPKRDPHQGVLRPGLDPIEGAPRPRLPSWPATLGFAGAADRGLAIALGWSSLPPADVRWAHPFSWAYAACFPVAQAVASLIRRAADARAHGGKIDLFAHSLGARIAFLALRRAAMEGWSNRIGRILALGAAEYRDQALRAARCCREGGPEVFNYLSRANDPYDAALQLLGPRPTFTAQARPLGAGGLGRRSPGWIDIQIDHPSLAPWLHRQGIAPAQGARLCCHGGFYTRPGIAAFHRRTLDQRWGGEDLRRSGVQEALEPRWARFGVGRRRDLPPPPQLVGGREVETARRPWPRRSAS
ncbi:MAG: hypothetical protein MRY74_05685 [Neomegalonema sp.]|nr:hypothetical protein [Neomegalonema sp.]